MVTALVIGGIIVLIGSIVIAEPLGFGLGFILLLAAVVSLGPPPADFNPRAAIGSRP